MEAEDFQSGGEGVAYHDTTPGNAGGAYRKTDVDIQSTTDVNGGFNVGWIEGGEWLQYTVLLPVAGIYTVSARLASGSAGTKKFHLEVDGTAAPTVSLISESGWQVWSTLPAGTFPLTAGNHTLRFISESNGLNINYFDFVGVPTPPACGLGPDLVPGCGALWGARFPSLAEAHAMEAAVGRTFAIEKDYMDFTGTLGSWIIAEANGGRIMHIAWESQLYHGVPAGMPTPDGRLPTTGRYYYSWRTVSSGRLDAYIDSFALSVKAFGKPLFMDYSHEMDIAETQMGTPADFVAAYRHLVARFRAVGATNVKWAWVVSGWRHQTSYDATYAALYPGDDVVDWVGWDPYNAVAGRWTDALTTFKGFYDVLDRTGIGAGKPRMLGEYGCLVDPRQASWLQGIPDALKALPKLKAVQYYNSGSWGYFAPGTDSSAAFAVAGKDAYLGPAL